MVVELIGSWGEVIMLNLVTVLEEIRVRRREENNYRICNNSFVKNQWD